MKENERCMKLYYDEVDEVWKEYKEPFATVSFQTEEDYEGFENMCEFWNKFGSCKGRIEEMLAADKEGRAIILPFLPGTVVYDFSEFFDGTEHPEWYKLNEGYFCVEKLSDDAPVRISYDGIYIVPDAIGKTAFFSQEEGEEIVRKRMWGND